MSVEGPISSVEKISPRKKPPKSKLASILDGQVNGLTFLLNNLPCRLSVLPDDGRHWRPTLTVAKNDDRHWRPSMSVVKNGARQWRPTLTVVTVGRHWRLVCTGLNTSVFLGGQPCSTSQQAGSQRSQNFVGPLPMPKRFDQSNQILYGDQTRW